MFLIICHLLDSSIKQFFIEEPEIGVHPKQLGKLMTILKEQSQYKQIILTTHSPDVLDVLTINELDRIFVCKLNNEGTKLYKLDEKRRLKAKAYMTEVDYLSSYWRMSDLENVEV
jgi:predicted ATPase